MRGRFTRLALLIACTLPAFNLGGCGRFFAPSITITLPNSLVYPFLELD